MLRSARGCSWTASWTSLRDGTVVYGGIYGGAVVYGHSAALTLLALMVRRLDLRVVERVEEVEVALHAAPTDRLVVVPPVTAFAPFVELTACTQAHSTRRERREQASKRAVISFWAATRLLRFVSASFRAVFGAGCGYLGLVRHLRVPACSPSEKGRFARVAHHSAPGAR